MFAGAADSLDVVSPTDHHAVPSEHGLIHEWLGKVAIERNHHFSDATLGWWDATVSAFKTQLAAQQTLHAVAVEQLTFGLGGFKRFAGHDLDGDGGAVIVTEMPDRTDEKTGPLQEAGFKCRQRGALTTKFRPIWLLLIPLHEQ